jgi:hypothetical protein
MITKHHPPTDVYEFTLEEVKDALTCNPSAIKLNEGDEVTARWEYNDNFAHPFNRVIKSVVVSVKRSEPAAS